MINMTLLFLVDNQIKITLCFYFAIIAKCQFGLIFGNFNPFWFFIYPLNIRRWVDRLSTNSFRWLVIICRSVACFSYVRTRVYLFEVFIFFVVNPCKSFNMTRRIRKIIISYYFKTRKFLWSLKSSSTFAVELFEIPLLPLQHCNSKFPGIQDVPIFWGEFAFDFVF